jgi:DNA-binding NtrC family response regulator
MAMQFQCTIPGFSSAFREGRFLAALQILEKAGTESLELRLVRAQLVALVGRIGEAERAFNALPKFVPGQTEEARAFFVQGLVSLSRAELEVSASHFLRASTLAEQYGDAYLACECRQMRMALVADSASAEAASPLIAETRTSVLTLGDPSLLAAFHVRLARVEAQRGALTTASRHLTCASEILSSHENYFVRGQWSLVSSGVSALSTDFDKAVQYASDAVATAEVSGHKQTENAARSNLALFLLLAGRTKEAERNLRSVVPVDFTQTKEIGPLDNYAQLLLLRGDFKKCELVLAEISRRLRQHPEHWTSWQELEALQTSIRLAMRRARWTDGLRLAQQAIRVAQERGDRLLEQAFNILAAECLLKTGAIEQAGDRLAEVESTPDYQSPALKADLHRVAGLLLASNNHHKVGVRRVERARHIAEILGPLFTRRDVETSLQELTAGGEITDSQLSQTSERAITLDCVAALLDLSGNPELIGREAFALLQETRACTALALVARRPRRAIEILASDGWDDARAAAAVRASGPHAVLPLGQRGDRSFDLIVEPAPDLLSRCTVVAIRKVVAAALSLEAYRRDERQRASLWPAGELEPGGQDIVASAAMLETLATARKVAPLEIPVLVTGETGTGKEMLARAIHRASPRAARPFLPFNCTAIPREMLESQLFGYRRGAFTGAQEPFPGVIRAAAGGTLFLDEIGDLPLEVQPKLLRFLDTHEIHPLGEPQPIRVDVRIVAATNANLDQMVGQSRFREDLFYRINVIRFQLPPLRERREEIPPMARHFLQRAAEEFRKGRLRLSDETVEYLLLYGWPGNVRQLANEIRRMAALAEPDSILEPTALSADVQASRRTIRVLEPQSVDEIRVRVDQPLPDALAAIERQMVSRALERADGRFEEAARLLGISRKGLFLKRRRWGVQTHAS